MKKLLLLLLCVPLIGFGQETGCISGDCDNGVGTYVLFSETLTGGSTYSGYFKDGKFNGKGEIVGGFGRFEGDEADYYIIGNWKDGKLHGDAITYNSNSGYVDVKLEVYIKLISLAL